MPIDFAAIAAPFEVPLAGQLKDVRRAIQAVGKWLSKRLEAARSLERATRDYPALDFYNGALTVSVVRAQRGALAPPGGAPSVWENLADGGRAFARGLGQVADSVRQELALPRIVRTLAEMLETVVAALDRFAVPGKEMFALDRARRASDLFGIAGLAFRALASGREQVERFAGGIAALRDALRSLGGGGGQGSSTGGGLDSVVRYLAAALLMLPLFGRLLMPIVRSASLALKLRLLDLFQGIERQVHALRRAVIDLFFVDLRRLGRDAFDLLGEVSTLALASLRFFGRFAVEYLARLLPAIRTFLTDLSHLIGYWAMAFPRILSAIERFDLLASVPYVPISFTISDLIDYLTDPAEREKWDDRLRWAAIAAGAIPYVGRLVSAALELLRRLLRALPPPIPLPRETGLPPVAPRFPDIYRQFVRPGAPPFGRALRDLATSVRSGVGEILGSGVDLLERAGRTFTASAGEVARLGSAARFRALAGRADAFGRALFGSQADELGRRIAGRPVDPLARSFEQWAARGGIEIVGAAISVFLRRVRRHVEERRAGGRRPAPTSPHILARRRRPGRVRVPRVMLRAPGRGLDAELSAAVAARFQGLVREAFQAGEERLAASAA